MKPRKQRKIKTPEERIKNYSSMAIYFRTGEKQLIEKELGRKSTSRDYIDTFKASIGL